jgi:hypothetical protein
MVVAYLLVVIELVLIWVECLGPGKKSGEPAGSFQPAGYLF